MSLLDTKLYLREKLEPSLTLLSCHGKCFPPRIHAYVSMSLITSNVPTITSPHPLPPDWGGYARRMVGVRRSTPTQPRRGHSALLRGRILSFPFPSRSLPPPPPFNFPSYYWVCRCSCSSPWPILLKITLLCYASILLWVAVMLWGWVLLCSINKLFYAWNLEPVLQVCSILALFRTVWDTDTSIIHSEELCILELNLVIASIIPRLSHTVQYMVETGRSLGMRLVITTQLCSHLFSNSWLQGGQHCVAYVDVTASLTFPFPLMGS